MTKWRVRGTMATYWTQDVEAETEEEALAKADLLPLQEWEVDHDNGIDWEVLDEEQMKEEDD